MPPAEHTRQKKSSAKSQPDHREWMLLKLHAPVESVIHFLLQFEDVLGQIIPLLLDIPFYLFRRFSHSMFSFILSMVFSGAAFTSFMRSIPSRTKPPAMMAVITPIISAASQAASGIARA